ncbi:hypothetical protein DKY63_29945 [Pseudomonas putida]|uniref:Uncharacterized protein n=1 Tax=Pseudomonas putida TaxID=303 RepID=A0A2Z4RTC7_PSEPU|nr:hypothetical protein [Pseudomonas putida]AWY43905.1 hypothetical protein DKY63_29945 [Pseudomonas putida]
MSILKALSVFSFGLYSFVGAGAMIALYFALYGVRCVELRMERKPPPSDRVVVFIIVAALAGILVGSLAQGLAEIRDECAAYGQTPKACLMKRLGR